MRVWQASDREPRLQAGSAGALYLSRDAVQRYTGGEQGRQTGVRRLDRLAWRRLDGAWLRGCSEEPGAGAESDGPGLR